MLDTVRGYAAVAAGLAEAGARAAWESVTSRPGDDETTGSSAGLPRQVQDTVDGVLASSRQNSELLVGLVRTEVERAVGRLGFVREEELAAVRRHVQRLETQLARITGRAPDPTGAVVVEDDVPAAAPHPPATKPAKRPATKPAKRPATKPAKRPATKPAKRPAKRAAATATTPPEAGSAEDDRTPTTEGPTR